MCFDHEVILAGVERLSKSVHGLVEIGVAVIVDNEAPSAPVATALTGDSDSSTIDNSSDDEDGEGGMVGGMLGSFLGKLKDTQIINAAEYKM